MSSKNTGNYKLCRHQEGVGSSITTLSEHTSKEDALTALNQITKEDKWKYYCEEEVIYSGTLLDDNNNPIDSVPTWIRISV